MTTVWDEAGWSTADVARLTGLTFRQIDYWTRGDTTIAPSIRRAAGIGSNRRWSTADVAALHAIADVDRDFASFDAAMPAALVTRIWDACHAQPDTDPIVLNIGTITITLARRMIEDGDV